MFHWVANNSKFPADKWRFDKIDPHCSVSLSKSNVFLLIYCKLKTNLIAKSQLLYMACPLTRKHKQKKNPIYIFISVRVRLRESVRLREYVNTEFDGEVGREFEKGSVSRAVRLRECVRLREYVNTEFDWEVDREFEKASVSRAVRLRECPLAESWLYTVGLKLSSSVFGCRWPGWNWIATWKSLNNNKHRRHMRQNHLLKHTFTFLPQCLCARLPHAPREVEAVKSLTARSQFSFHKMPNAKCAGLHGTYRSAGSIYSVFAHATGSWSGSTQMKHERVTNPKISFNVVWKRANNNNKPYGRVYWLNFLFRLRLLG